MKYELLKCAGEGFSAKVFYFDLLKPLLDLFLNTILVVIQLGERGFFGCQFFFFFNKMNKQQHSLLGSSAPKQRKPSTED